MPVPRFRARCGRQRRLVQIAENEYGRSSGRHHYLRLARPAASIVVSSSYAGGSTDAMKSHLKPQTWTSVAWVAALLLSGPGTVAAGGLVAGVGFVVLPGKAPKFGGPQGRERDFTELVATAGQTGGSFGMFRQ